jgi:hypothetical protein
VPAEIKDRGVADVPVVAGDGLKALPEAINAAGEHATVQTCVTCLLRGTFRYAWRAHWDSTAQGPAPRLHGPHGGRRRGEVLRVLRTAGRPAAGDREAVDLGGKENTAVPGPGVARRRTTTNASPTHRY